MTDIYVENHLFSLLCSLTACEEILDILPDKDMVDELKFLIDHSQEILMCVIEEKHFGTDNLDWFMQYTMNLKEEIGILRESIQKK
jgi:hypothetical protein